MTPLRGLKGCCHLLFCGNGIDFYFALSGPDLVCNLSTGLHPVLIYDTLRGLKGCCHLLFCGNGIDFYSALSGLIFYVLFIRRASPCADIFYPFGARKGRLFRNEVYKNGRSLLFLGFSFYTASPDSRLK